MGVRGLLLAIIALVLPPAPQVAADGPCPGLSLVVVAGAPREDRERICAAAARAVAFLARYGLSPQRAIAIDITQHPIDNQGFPAFGRYRSDIDRIEVMSFPAILAEGDAPKMLGEPFDRVHYAGVVAHEVAHAVVEPRLRAKRFAVTPQEYLAYATQMAVLPDERRHRIIAATGVGPWEGGDAITSVYMAVAPGKFAVKSYLHLVSLEDPGAFVQLLLDNNWFDVYVPREHPAGADRPAPRRP